MTDTPLNLVAAMRRGIPQNPPGKFAMRDIYGNTCAVGAACVGAGVTLSFPAAELRFPVLTRRVKHPVQEVTSELISILVSLNDSHGWTRERIADWLEQEGITV